MSQVKHICKKYNKELTDPDVLELKSILGRHMGYFTKMSEWVFKTGSTLEEIKDIIDLLQIVKINKPINDFKSSEQLYDHICEVQNKRKLNQVLKSIPSINRKNVSSRIEKLIYSNIEKQELFKDYFSKKGGTCKTEDDLYQRISEIINLSEGGTSYMDVLKRIKKRIFIFKLWSILWNTLLFLPRIAQFNWVYGGFNDIMFNTKKHGKIVYKDGKTIIVQVNSFRLSALIGSRHWCISTRKSYWNSYNSEAKETIQYFIYQTEFKNNESMIGVTVAPGGIKTHTHYKDDSGCYNSDSYLQQYSKYLKGKEVSIDYINDVIKYNVTDLNTIFKFDNWDTIFDKSFYQRISGNMRDENNTYMSSMYSDTVYMDKYLNKLLTEVYNNRELYSHEDLCKFFYTFLRDKFDSTPKKDFVRYANIINYDDPYFCDDENVKDYLTYLKIVSYLTKNKENIFQAYNNSNSDSPNYGFYSTGYYGQKIYRTIHTDSDIFVDSKTYRKDKSKYIHDQIHNYVANDISVILSENINFMPNWDELKILDKIRYLNKVYTKINNEYTGTRYGM